jgi:hypothetical protein
MSEPRVIATRLIAVGALINLEPSRWNCRGRDERDGSRPPIKATASVPYLNGVRKLSAKR